MTTKKISGAIRPASYLSPMDLRRAMQLTQKIKAADKVEEVIHYQKQLERLIERAERNKARIDRRIRQQALELKKKNRDEIRAKYSSLRTLGSEAGLDDLEDYAHVRIVNSKPEEMQK